MNSPAEIAKNYILIGKDKVKMPFLKTFLLAIMAGMFIAIAGAGASVAVVSVDVPSLAKVLSGCISREDWQW